YGALPFLPAFPTRRSSDLVASDDCDPGRAGSVEHPLESAETRPPVTGRRRAAAHRSSLSECGPRVIPGRAGPRRGRADAAAADGDRKSTRLTSSHVSISYA